MEACNVHASEAVPLCLNSACLPASRACRRPLQTLRDMMERLMDLGMVKRLPAGAAKGAAAGKAGACSAARQVAVQAA